MIFVIHYFVLEELNGVQHLEDMALEIITIL